MPSALLKLFAAAALAVGLSACANSPALVPAASYVDTVDVELTQNLASPRFAEALRTKTRREATRYGRKGEAKHLRIVVTDVHYKNPALSLLVGDANRARAKVTVTDQASGRAHGAAEVWTIDNFAINGVIGAVVAAAQDKAEVDQRLAQGLASDVLEKVYGSQVAAEARKRPVAEVVEPAPQTAPAAPGAAPKPAAPKPVPTASAPQERKTAMAAQERKTAMAAQAIPTPTAR